MTKRGKILIAGAILSALLAIALVGTGRLLDAKNWELVCARTGLQIPCSATIITTLSDPALVHSSWVIARVEVPTTCVQSIVRKNAFEPTDRVSLDIVFDAIRPSLQTVSKSGRKYYKSGQTETGLPFEAILDEQGHLVVFMATPD